MERSLIRKEVLPFLAMFGSLILATIFTDALLHQFDLVWIGRWLGIPGTVLNRAVFTSIARAGGGETVRQLPRQSE